MIKFLHLSDRHWLSGDRYNGENHRLLDYFNAYYPDHIIMETGDMSDDGDEAQLGNVSKAMEHRRGRWYFVPGNHDFGWQGNFYDEERARRFDEMLSVPFQDFAFAGANEPMLRMIEGGNEKAAVIGLDSNIETPHPFDFAQGQIGQGQLWWLMGWLAKKPDDPCCKIIVMLHHHPFHHSDPTMRLLDSREFLAIIYGKVDIMLFGHRHVAGMWRNINGIPLVMAAPASSRNDYVQEITIDGPHIWTRAIPWRKL